MNRFVQILVSASVVLALPLVSAADIYVSPTGNDANAGSESRPFATLEAARDAARKLRAGRLVVPRRPHDLAARWRLPAHVTAGTDRRRFRDRRQPRGVAVLPGRVGATTGRSPADGVQSGHRSRRCWSGWTSRHDRCVREVDLRALGITEFGEMASRGFGRPTVPAHCELFIDGQPMTLARWPNEGEWEQIAGFPEANAQDDGHGGKIGKLEDGFHYAGDRPRRWKDTSDLWVHGYWSWDWANSYERVASLDLEQRLIKTAPPYGQYGFRTGQRFYFLNVLEELDQPGEWCARSEGGQAVLLAAAGRARCGVTC